MPYTLYTDGVAKHAQKVSINTACNSPDQVLSWSENEEGLYVLELHENICHIFYHKDLSYQNWRLSPQSSGLLLLDTSTIILPNATAQSFLSKTTHKLEMSFLVQPHITETYIMIVYEMIYKHAPISEHTTVG
jgi:hypothetical protein